MKRPLIVIIGAGFGGIEAAKKLKNATVDILLIDRMNHHLFQPLLYQVATGALSETDIAMPIREVFTRQRNIKFCIATVTNIEKEKKQIILDDGQSISYDYLIVSPGANNSYFGHKEWEAFAPSLKTLQDAIDIRERIVTSFEKADRWNNNKEEEAKNLTFAIIGAGPRGVELAGAIGEIAFKMLPKQYKNIDPSLIKVYLLEACPRILPPFPEEVSLKAQKALELLGVTVLTNTLVKNISENCIELIDKKMIAGTIIWSTGNEAPPLLKSLQSPLDRQGRVLVQPDLSIEGFRELFVIGDAACCLDQTQQPFPALAAVAKQQGAHVASLIIKKSSKYKRKPFVYKDRGIMAAIGRGKAVAVIKDRIFSGILAWLAWYFIHIWYLIDFKNRFFTLFRWLFLYVAYHHPVLLMKQPIDKEKTDPI